VIPTSPTSLLVQWSQPEQSSGAILHYNMFYMEVRVVKNLKQRKFRIERASQLNPG
jgi:hypothetical protein